MAKIRPFLLAAMLLLVSYLPGDTTQSSLVLPTTGPHTMNDFVVNFNNPALRAILTNFAGTTAPTVGTGGAAEQYQFWMDTSTTPPTFRLYDGANWVPVGTLNTSTHRFTPLSIQPGSLDQPVNFGLQATVAASALTVTLTDTANATPSATDPVTYLVQALSSNNPNGQVTTLTQSAALSITVPSGATLGTSNGVPFRVWIGVANNAGTLVPMVFTCSVPGTITINPMVEGTVLSATGVTNASNSSGVWYGSSATTNTAWRLIGYLDFDSGEATAGTWNTAPTRTVVWSPGMKKCGDVVQTAQATGTTTTTTTASTTSLNTTVDTINITPTNKQNFVRVRTTFQFSATAAAAGNLFVSRLYRGGQSTGLGQSISITADVTATATPQTGAAEVIDAPQSTSSTQYDIVINNAQSAASNTCTLSNWTIIVDEIMGALEPANDNGLPPLPKAA